MGGFDLAYVEGSQILVNEVSGLDIDHALTGYSFWPIIIPYDAERISTDGQFIYLLTWGTPTKIYATVVDTRNMTDDDPTDVRVGSVIEFDGNGNGAGPVHIGWDEARGLDRWVMVLGGSLGEWTYQPFTVGDGIPLPFLSPPSIGSGGTPTTLSGLSWQPGDTGAPDSHTFGGHPFAGEPAPTFSVSGPPALGGLTWSGPALFPGDPIAYVMVPGQLEWQDALGNDHTEIKLCPLNLNDGIVGTAFGVEDYGFAPRNESVVSADRTFRLVTDSDGFARIARFGDLTSDPMSGRMIAALSADDQADFIGTFLSQMAQAAGSAEGDFWTAVRTPTAHTWSYTEQWGQTAQMFRIRAPIDRASITPDVVDAFTYTADNDSAAWPTGATPGPPAAAGSILSLFGGTARSSMRIDDTHLRAEDPNPARFPQPPGLTIYSTDPVHGGTPRDTLTLTVFTDDFTASTQRTYLAVLREEPLPPIASFTVTPSTEKVGSPFHFDGRVSYFLTRDSWWHPISDFHWEFDDGTVGDTTGAIKDRAYHRPSTLHVAGSQTPDHGTNPGVGETGYYLPVLYVANSIGLTSVPVDDILLTVTGQSPLRQFPRDDGLGMSTQRSVPKPTTTQTGSRRGPTAIT